MAEKAACGLVQYIALRGDLLRVDKWPIGAMVAQACHASAAVLHQFKDDSNTQQYLKDLDSMHKVVLEVSKIKPLIEQSLVTKLNNRQKMKQNWLVSLMLYKQTKWTSSCGLNNRRILRPA